MIYYPTAPDGYDSLQFTDDDCGNQFLVDSDGKSIAATWQPKGVKILTSRRNRRRADLPSLASSVIALRRRALDALGDVLADHGEVLPLLPVRGEEFFLFNATRVIDALDEENSLLTRFPGGRIMSIDAPTFIEPKIRGVHLFKLPNQRVNPIFVSDYFAQRVQSAGLTGMGFTPAWSPEHGRIRIRYF